jgi:dTDP-4-amino-4,6-dideoxygalactose transaminase
LALGVEPDDHVVTSPFTFFASAATIALVGARPVLADVDPNTGLLDCAKAAAAVDAETTCIVPVHLYGQLADMRDFRRLADERSLSILEDGAQAHAARRDGYACASLGDAGTFSFYPTKNLSAAGEGGLVLTRHEHVARKLRELRDHGSAQKYVHGCIGTNSRLHALQAAILRVKLPHLERWNARRRELARIYDGAFAGHSELAPLEVAKGATHVYHQYTLRIRGPRSRDEVQAALAQQGIAAAIHYPAPVHLQEAARPWGYGPGDFPAAETLAREVLCLPVHPFLTDGDARRVAAAVLDAAAR